MNITKHRNNTLIWSRGEYPYKYKVEILTKTGAFKKKVQFGRLPYQHYKDSTPLKIFSYLDHDDKKRRTNYRKRHSKIKLKDGRFAYKVPYTSSWFSYNFLW